MTRHRVAVVGAGFGGLAAVRELAGASVDVTLVDQRNFHTFLPLLYQVATAGLNAADVAYPVRGIFQRQANVRFRRATVTGVDWKTRTLLVDAGPAIAFDSVILGAGAVAAWFGVAGAAENSYPLYTLRDSTQLRNHVLERFEAADAEPGLVDDGAITFVVVGGGATGVEVAGALAELFDVVLRKDFRTLDVSRARIVLVEARERLLAPFAPPSQRHALETLVARGVEVRLDTAVSEVNPTRVVLESGDEIPSHTLIWAAGVEANPLAGAIGVDTGRAGRVKVGADLRVAAHPHAYAIGDVAEIPDGRGGTLPQLAQVAIQSGRHAARQVRRELEGRPLRPFRYRNKGTMATIGRRAAVAEIPHLPPLRGTVAWFAWLGLHLIYLMGFRNRLSVFLNWAWNYFTWDRGPRLIFRQET